MSKLSYDFTLTAEQIESKSSQLILEYQLKVELLENIKVPTFDNFVNQKALLDAEYSYQMQILDFYQYVSEDADVREASREVTKLWDQLQVDISQSERLYQNYQTVAKSATQLNDPVDLKLLNDILLGFKRSGMDLPIKQRQQLKEFFNRESELSIEFQKNTSEDKSYVLLSTSQLKGMDQDYLKRTQIEDPPNFHKVTGQYPDVIPLLQYCQNPKSRAIVMEMFENRAPGNFPVLIEILNVRQQIAELLGYNNIAEYRMEVQMTENLETTRHFLKNILTQLSPHCQNYLKQLSSDKQQEEKTDQSVQYQDYAYYHQKNLQKNYQIDHQVLKEYFPLDYVTQAMLELFAEIFNLQFESAQPESTWSQQHTSFYHVFDASSQKMIGQFFMDMHPREGKYTHAAMWDLIPGFRDRQGHQIIPLATLVCNFTPPTENKPSLLTFSEVNTLFHEFGHVIHGLCGGYKAKYSDLSGTNVETDFVEAPSQMIEQWLWEPVVLQRISRHYKTKQPLPQELIASLLKTQYVGKARDWTRQGVLSSIDQVLHSKGGWTELEMRKIYQKISLEFMGYQSGTGSMLQSFGHLSSQYGAKYYSYIWSRMIASDLYSKFQESGNPLNREVGMLYRTSILEPGGSLTGKQMVQNYLGRETNLDAFMQSLGLSKEQQGLEVK